LDVNVGGSLFDVRFVDGACIGVFGPCSPMPVNCLDVSPFSCSSAYFLFKTSHDAVDASYALVDQVFSAPNFFYDDIPYLTNGCGGTYNVQCFILTPFLISRDYQHINRHIVSAQTAVNVESGSDLYLGLDVVGGTEVDDSQH